MQINTKYRQVNLPTGQAGTKCGGFKTKAGGFMTKRGGFMTKAGGFNSRRGGFMTKAGDEKMIKSKHEGKCLTFIWEYRGLLIKNIPIVYKYHFLLISG